jgi:hypothetical protein
MRAPSKQVRKKISRQRRDWDASSKADSAPSSADGSASQLADWRRKTSFRASTIIVRSGSRVTPKYRLDRPYQNGIRGGQNERPNRRTALLVRGAYLYRPSGTRQKLTAAIRAPPAHAVCAYVAERAFIAADVGLPTRAERGVTLFAFGSHFKRHSSRSPKIRDRFQVRRV